MKAKPLDSRSARMDLTDRECTKILGGMLGTLADMTDIETLRNAVRWWAETDAAWQALSEVKVIQGRLVMTGGERK